jgi:hypothetical protein
MITPYRIKLDHMTVLCNYPGYVVGKKTKAKHYTEKELLARGDFVKDTSRPYPVWYHYITEEEFKRLWKPNIFNYIQDPLLLFTGMWDADWTMEYDEVEELL